MEAAPPSLALLQVAAVIMSSASGGASPLLHCQDQVPHAANFFPAEHEFQGLQGFDASPNMHGLVILRCQNPTLAFN